MEPKRWKRRANDVGEDGSNHGRLNKSKLVLRQGDDANEELDGVACRRRKARKKGQEQGGNDVKNVSRLAGKALWR